VCVLPRDPYFFAFCSQFYHKGQKGVKPVYKFKPLAEDETIVAMATDPEAPRHESATTPEAKKLLNKIQRRLAMATPGDPAPLVLDADRRGKPVAQPPSPSFKAEMRKASEKAAEAKRRKGDLEKVKAARKAVGRLELKLELSQSVTADLQNKLDEASSEIQLLKAQIAALQQEATDTRRDKPWSYEGLMRDEELAKQVTGLDQVRLPAFAQCILKVFQFDAYWKGKRTPRLSAEDALVLTLIRLRRNIPVIMLARMFDIGRTAAERAFYLSVFFLARVNACLQHALDKSEINKRRYKLMSLFLIFLTTA
jgi:hypothetical protein